MRNCAISCYHVNGIDTWTRANLTLCIVCQYVQYFIETFNRRVPISLHYCFTSFPHITRHCCSIYGFVGRTILFCIRSLCPVLSDLVSQLFSPAIIFKFVVARILLQGWKRMIIARSQIRNVSVRCPAVLSYEMINHVNLYFDRSWKTMLVGSAWPKLEACSSRKMIMISCVVHVMGLVSMRVFDNKQTIFSVQCYLCTEWP